MTLARKMFSRRHSFYLLSLIGFGGLAERERLLEPAIVFPSHSLA